ncbi:AAA family ATPase [Sorangium sp. So ce185]|uniref:AAA family ATPase n=1 Tax=Sorangium sp. So ce185 TaxID=3133287 RepID=UPI003F608ECF
MMPPSRFTIYGTIDRGQRNVLYRAVRNEDERPVILKVLASKHPHPRDIARLQHEREICCELTPRAAVRCLEITTFEGAPALVVEDFGGVSLASLLGAPMRLGQFLSIAAGIAAALADIHQLRIVHKDVKPGNILVNLATNEVKLTEFGIATRFPREQQAAHDPELIEGSLPYMSPEQTGRMNRAVDHRTDLYSLGVTFYEMLTGARPFHAEDPLEWIHCHIARSPVPPAQRVPGVPHVVSDIVMKLLSKVAEDRYQSARALAADLVRCHAALGAKAGVNGACMENGIEAWVEPFPLGERDVSDWFQIPQRLYGRDADVAELLRAFERVAASATPELMLVSGYAGTGKSTLVNELNKPIARARGFFISGKADQYKQNTPYSTIVQAFRELVLEILAQSEAQIGRWRERLKSALGANAQIIIDVIPYIALILGPQPPVPEIPLTEAQNRFNMVFRRFIDVFAQREHPLALFLDDLQWADPASLKLLHDVVTNPDTKYLFTIGAYRDNEVTPSHPLMSTLEEMRRAGVIIHDIVLSPLSPRDLASLVADTLRCRSEAAEQLSELVYAKTAGNPFFAKQFLSTLHKDALIEFDPEPAAWRWDVQQIRARNFTDNVVDLMVEKLRSLPAATQDALKIAACMGAAADVRTLAAIHKLSEQEILPVLWDAVQEGLLVLQGDACRFVHDRVQQAAYQLIPDALRREVHLTIGRLLLSHAPREALEEQVFDIVGHLNIGAALISSQDERYSLAELNLVAAKRARATTAYASAASHLEAGIALLAHDSWDTRYELTYGLHLLRAECEHLNGSFEEAARLLSLVLRRAKTPIDVMSASSVKVYNHTIQEENEEALQVGIDCLRLFGIDLSLHPTREEVHRKCEKIWRDIGDRRIKDLIDLPIMTNANAKAVVNFLATLHAPALFFDSNLLCLLLCHQVELSIQYGNTDGSTIGYVFFGVVPGPMFGKYREGYEFGELGYALVEERGLTRYKAKVYVEFAILIRPWTHHLRSILDILRRAFDAAVEVGDLTYACYAQLSTITLLIVRGDPLDSVYRESERALDFARRARFAAVEHIVIGQQRLIQNLRGLTRSFSSYSDAQFDQDEFEDYLTRNKARVPLAALHYFVWKTQARFMSGDYKQALHSAGQAKDLLWVSPVSLESAEHCFYDALTLAACCEEGAPDERSEHLEKLAAQEERLREGESSCPENFLYKRALLAAEIARITGEDHEAMRLYERAIRAAKENAFVSGEGLCLELASRFYRERGFEAFADTYLREARHCYLRWGANGKVRQLEQQHPELAPSAPSAANATFAARAEHLDLVSVVKASQTISGEIVLERLIRRMIQVVMEQGGAQRGCLLLARDGILQIEAEARIDEGGLATTMLGSIPASSSSLVPTSIIAYVWRARQPVILADAAREIEVGKFSSDEYLARARPRSVLCVPIVRQTEPIGILYLENNLAAGAFTADRLAILEVLAAQAAISLENALLVLREHEARVAAEDALRLREEFLAVASHELRTPLTPLRLQLQRVHRTLTRQNLHALAEQIERPLRQVDRLTALVVNLIDVAQLSNSQLVLRLQPVDLAALVSRVVADYRDALHQSGCALELNAGAPVIGRWDAERIEQVVVALLSNAMKYGAGRPIVVAVVAEGALAKLSVRDLGIGVAAEDRDRIFGRFERAVSVQHYGGLGLGLYIARQIVLAHHGTILLESELREGTTFIVELPLASPGGPGELDRPLAAQPQGGEIREDP